MNKQEYLKHVESSARVILGPITVLMNKSQSDMESVVNELMVVADQINTEEAYIFDHSNVPEFMGIKMYPLKDKVLLINNNSGLITSIEIIPLNENQTPNEKIKEVQELMEKASKLSEDFCKGLK